MKGDRGRKKVKTGDKEKQWTKLRKTKEEGEEGKEKDSGDRKEMWKERGQPRKRYRGEETQRHKTVKSVKYSAYTKRALHCVIKTLVQFRRT